MSCKDIKNGQHMYKDRLDIWVGYTCGLNKTHGLILYMTHGGFLNIMVSPSKEDTLALGQAHTKGY